MLLALNLAKLKIYLKLIIIIMICMHVCISRHNLVLLELIQHYFLIHFA